MQEGGGREELFKSNSLGNKKRNERARQQQLTLRRKREEKLDVKRQLVRSETPAAEENFTSLFQKFNAQAFYRDPLPQLDLITDMLFFATSDDMERYFTHIFGPKAENLGKLIEGCANEHVIRRCVKAVNNVAHLKHHAAAVSVAILLKEKLIPIFVAHLERTQGQMESTLQSFFWQIVIAIVNSCPEARDEVLASPLFCYRFPCKDLDEQPGFATSPFLKVLQLAFEPNRKNDDVVLLPTLATVIASIVTSERSEQGNEDPLPPWLFCFVTWKYVCRFIMERSRRREPTHRVGDGDTIYDDELQASLLSMLWMLRYLPDEQRGSLLTKINIVELMQQLGYLAFHVSPNNTVRIMKIFVQISTIRMADCAFHEAMKASKCVDIMLRAVDDPKPSIRAEAMLWAGNFMMDGTEYVSFGMTSGIVKQITMSIRNHSQFGLEVCSRAIYSMMAMFRALDADIQNKNASFETRQSATGLLRALLHRHRFIQLVMPLLNRFVQEFSLVIVRDILKILRIAVKFDRDLTMSAMMESNGEEVLDELFARISQLQESPNNCSPLSKAVEKTLNLFEFQSKFSRKAFDLTFMETTD
jgi:hypothetical protein